MLSRLLPICLTAVGLFAAGMPRFDLRDTSGGTHSAAEWRGQKAILLFFVTIDCPVGNSYVPEMNRIREEYAKRGVVVWAVQADTTIADAKVVQYAKDYHYTFPLLLDPRQALVSLTGATVTPEAVVLTPEGQVVYHGRVDNR